MAWRSQEQGGREGAPAGGGDDSDYAVSVLVAGVSEVRNDCGSERREDKDECERQYLREGVRHGWIG